jgi:CMP/dCMP kinase
MHSQPHSASRINVITISSQYGSDGAKLAAKLAFQLRWQLAEQEIITRAAYLSGIEEEEALLYAEHSYTFFDRILLSLRFMTPQALEAWASMAVLPAAPQLHERFYHEAQRQVVERIARTGNTVIVEQGAQAILAHRPGVLHVRIVAPFAQRVKNVMLGEQLHEVDALARVRQKDRDLARYLHIQHHRDIDDPLLYDLVINSTILAIESQLDLVCQTLRHKARCLALFGPEPYCQLIHNR